MLDYSSHIHQIYLKKINKIYKKNLYSGNTNSRHMNLFFFKNNSSLRYKFIINIKKIDIYFELRTPIRLKRSDSSGFMIKNLKAILSSDQKEDIQKY